MADRLPVAVIEPSLDLSTLSTLVVPEDFCRLAAVWVPFFLQPDFAAPID